MSRWRLILKHRRLLRRAMRVEWDLDFSSDFFRGSIAGPRLRESLTAERDRLEKEIEAIETQLDTRATEGDA